IVDTRPSYATMPPHPLLRGHIMISKIIAGVLAAAVLSVGGYAYWQYSSDSSEAGCETPGSWSSPETTTATPPRWPEPVRTKISAEPCCCCEGEDATQEVLTIQPHELK